MINIQGLLTSIDKNVYIAVTNIDSRTCGDSVGSMKITLDLLFFGEMSVSASSPPGVEESEGRPLLAAVDAAAPAADEFTEEDMEAS